MGLCWNNKTVNWKALKSCAYRQDWKRLADLDNSWVCEALVENVHVTSQLQGVHNEVFRPGGNLHEAGQPQEAPVRMVLNTRKEGRTGKTDFTRRPSTDFEVSYETSCRINYFLPKHRFKLVLILYFSRWTRRKCKNFTPSHLQVTSKSMANSWQFRSFSLSSTSSSREDTKWQGVSPTGLYNCVTKVQAEKERNVKNHPSLKYTWIKSSINDTQS